MNPWIIGGVLYYLLGGDNAPASGRRVQSLVAIDLNKHADTTNSTAQSVIEPILALLILLVLIGSAWALYTNPDVIDFWWQL